VQVVEELDLKKVVLHLESADPEFAINLGAAHLIPRDEALSPGNLVRGRTQEGVAEFVDGGEDARGRSRAPIA
jgi:hypothetical protein